MVNMVSHQIWVFSVGLSLKKTYKAKGKIQLTAAACCSAIKPGHLWTPSFSVEAWLCFEKEF
jgi:hypothetical protein